MAVTDHERPPIPHDDEHGDDVHARVPDDVSALDSTTHDQEQHAPGTPGVSSSSETNAYAEGITIDEEAPQGADLIAARAAAYLRGDTDQATTEETSTSSADSDDKYGLKQWFEETNNAVPEPEVGKGITAADIATAEAQGATPAEDETLSLDELIDEDPAEHATRGAETTTVTAPAETQKEESAEGEGGDKEHESEGNEQEEGDESAADGDSGDDTGDKDTSNNADEPAPKPRKSWLRKLAPWAAGAVGVATIGGVVGPKVVGGDAAEPVGANPKTPTEPAPENANPKVESQSPNTTKIEAPEGTVPENPYTTASGATIEYDVHPRQTIGDTDDEPRPLEPNDTLVTFRNSIGTPAIEAAIQSGEAKIDKGTCVVQTEVVTQEGGQKYTVDRILVSPFTFKEGKKYVYAGVSNQGDTRPIATEQDGNTVIAEAVGDKTTKIVKDNQSPPVPVKIEGALTPNGDDEPLVNKVISATDLPSNIMWENTGMLVRDADGTEYIAGGIALVITEGETGLTDTTRPNACAQLVKVSGL